MTVVSGSVVSTNRTFLYVARAGICILSTDVDTKPVEAYRNIYDKLNGDPRVKDLSRIPAGRLKVSRRTFSATADPDSDGEMQLDPDRHIHSIEFISPFRFNLQVPRRTQPKPVGISDVPSDEYWVEWNGILLSVLWKYDVEGDPFGYSGGLVAIEIIREVVEDVGLNIHVQPCGFGCDFPFTHTDVVMELREDAHIGLEESDISRPRERNCIMPLPDHVDPGEALTILADIIGFPSLCYAEMRSNSLAIRNAGQQAREDMDKLLTLLNDHTTVRPKLRLAYIKWRWQSRGWKRRVRHLIGRLWFALITIEARRQRWADIKFIYDDATLGNGRGLPFSKEYGQEVHSVTALNVNSIESAVQHANARLDNKSMVFATAYGAIAGGLVGTIATIIFH